jgi:hypothetical protein
MKATETFKEKGKGSLFNVIDMHQGKGAQKI